MTAGRGIVHAEMPAGDGDNIGLQLWINLKSEDKVNLVLVYPSIKNLLIQDCVCFSRALPVVFALKLHTCTYVHFFLVQLLPFPCSDD